MTDDESTALHRELEKLRKINRVLMDRVERSTDAQGNAFSLFQAAITLEKTVTLRTMELQALNRQLHAAKDEAERANRSKTKFFAAASHDLQQPLNIARLYLGALASSRLDESAGRTVSRIDASLESANNLLTTLLEMSRFDEAAMRPHVQDVAVDGLLEGISKDYAFDADERGLRFRVIPSDAVVRTDAHLLDRVLRNFVSNAFRYTARGGVLVGCRTRGDTLRIEVWDSGCGIPSDRLVEIFEEFRQLDVPEREPRGGLGLGLSIVERIAHVLGLAVRVRSRVGRGSVFSIDVPRAGAARIAPYPAVAHPTSPTTAPFTGKTILLVDDDEETLAGMRLVLETWGCRTIAARSASSAVEKTRRGAVCPDFIVADYHLGYERTGLEAIDVVRAAFDRPVGAVVLTADRTDETRARVAASGHWYLNKPVRIERLRSLMNHALA